MQTTGPVTLTLGQTTTIPQPPQLVAWRAVILANASPWATAVTTGAGPAQWLQPWSADLYPLPAAGPVTVTPAYQPGPGDTTAGTLTATWYTPDERPTGTYPAPLTAQALAAVVSQPTTGLLQVATDQKYLESIVNVVDGTYNIASIPTWATRLLVVTNAGTLPAPGGTPLGLVFYGHVTNTYLGMGVLTGFAQNDLASAFPVSGSSMVEIPVLPLVDSSVDLHVTALSAGGATPTLSIFALAGPVPLAAPSTQFAQINAYTPAAGGFLTPNITGASWIEIVQLDLQVIAQANDTTSLYATLSAAPWTAAGPGTTILNAVGGNSTSGAANNPWARAHLGPYEKPGSGLFLPVGSGVWWSLSVANEGLIEATCLYRNWGT